MSLEIILICGLLTSKMGKFVSLVIEFSSRNFVTAVALEDEGYLGDFENSIKVVIVLQFYLFHIAPQILLNKREVERVVSLTRTCGTEEMKEISYC